MDSSPLPSLQNTSPARNPAELSQLQATVDYHAQALHAFQAQLSALQNANASAPVPAASDSTPAIPMPLPEKFDGTPERCKGFLQQCRIQFTTRPNVFAAERSKCAFIFSLLTGQALDWATAVWDSDLQLQNSADYFLSQLREIFEYPAGGMDVSNQLMQLRQGNLSAAEYAIKFRTLAAQSGWNDVALKAFFKAGLNLRLQAELTYWDDSKSLSQFISLSVRTDNLLRNSPIFSSEATAGTAKESGVSHQTPEPMQLGLTKLTPQERQRRRQERLCFYCGEATHVCAHCPKKTPSRTTRL